MAPYLAYALPRCDLVVLANRQCYTISKISRSGLSHPEIVLAWMTRVVQDRNELTCEPFSDDGFLLYIATIINVEEEGQVTCMRTMRSSTPRSWNSLGTFTP